MPEPRSSSNERIESGIRTTESGADQYVALRGEWDGYITSLAPRFAFEMEEVDPALAAVK